MTAKETLLFEEFEKKRIYLNHAVWFRTLISTSLRYKKDIILTKLKEPGLLEFLESVLKDPIYASDLMTMRDLLKEDRFTLAKVSKVFSSLCVEEESCRFFL